MKTLKKGRKIKNTNKLKCPYCKSVLEYKPTDIVIDFRDGDYIVCPECKLAVNI